MNRTIEIGILIGWLMLSGYNFLAQRKILKQLEKLNNKN